MSSLEEMGGDIEGALEAISVPSYVIDASGVIRWLNPAATRLVGDVRGRHYTSVVAPEETRRARELFTQKILGTADVTDVEAVVLDEHGARIDVEISSVPLRRGGHVIGVFGQFADVPGRSSAAPHPQLTPRQTEILRLLQRGRSTDQIAQELKISKETVRNHIRDLLRALGAKSRLEAVALSRGG
jgi:PAS domain S-box-containing protein